jgi:hypothetical protein
MKSFTYFFVAVIAAMLSVSESVAQSASPKKASASTLKTFVIRRDIPNAGKLTPAELKSISQTSCTVLKEMGPKIEWIHSYVTGNQIYCIYKAESEEAIREHAQKGGFPANEIMEVATIISPATASL